jgi:hypothetical protein
VTKKTMDNVKSEKTTGLNRDVQSTIEVVAEFSLRCPRFAARVFRMEFRWKEQHWDRFFFVRIPRFTPDRIVSPIRHIRSFFMRGIKTMYRPSRRGNAYTTFAVLNTQF